MLAGRPNNPSNSQSLGRPLTGTTASASLALKFKSVGIDTDELDVLVQLLEHQPRVLAGADIIHAAQSAGHSTLLLAGIACSYKQLEAGSRQIYSCTGTCCRNGMGQGRCKHLRSA